MASGVITDQAKLERLGEWIATRPPVVAPLVHRFTPRQGENGGVYLREICMPKGAVIIGQEHTTEHFNIVLSGLALVLIDGKLSTVKAGDVFKSGAGVRKALLIKEEMRWITVHGTDETDVSKIEKKLTVQSEVFNRLASIQNLNTKEIQ